MTPEFRLNEDGTLDEAFVDDVKFFHIEQMDTNSWWVGVTTRADKMIHFYIGASRGLEVLVVDESSGESAYVGGVGARRRLARMKK